MTTLWVQLFTRWMQPKEHGVTWLALVMWLVLPGTGREWGSSPRPGLTAHPTATTSTTPCCLPAGQTSRLCSARVRCFSVTRGWRSDFQLRVSGWSKAKAHPSPQSQSLSHWNTFCRGLLLSPNQALGLALLNSDPGFYLILKMWKP